MKKQKRWEKELEKPLNAGSIAGAWPSRKPVESVGSAQTPWAESPEEIEEALRWGREKIRLLDWIRGAMQGCLTETERRSIELYYFDNLNYRDAAKRLGRNPSSVLRAARRGIAKLQRAAERMGVSLAWPAQPVSGVSTNDCAN